MPPGRIRYYRNVELDCRAWLDMPGGRRAYLLGDAYGPPQPVDVPPVGVFDRLTRGIWVQSSLRPPLRGDIGLWSLVGLARALGCAPDQVRAQLLAADASSPYRPLSEGTLRSWFSQAGGGDPAG
jgi:hypothetical protein